MAVVLEDGRFAGALRVDRAAAAMADVPAAAAVAIDIPIGLPGSGRRRADYLARNRLGARRSSVFFAPPRDVVETASYAAANALAMKRHGFGISRQSYALRPKILEVDELVRDDGRIHEVHPEVAFAAWHDGPLPSKKSYSGARRRLDLLEGLGVVLPVALGAAGAVPIDDVLDAAAAAVVAGKIVRGEAESLPDPPDVDATGVRMAIWV